MTVRRISIGIASAAVALVCVTAIPAASTVSAALPTFLRYSTTAKAKESFVVTRRFHARGPTLASFPAAGTGRVRVVVESGSPAAALSSIEAAGGRIERSWRNLIQASVSANAVASLGRAQAIGRVRAPYRHVEEAVNGEEVAADLAPAWHAKGFTGKNVKVAIIDGGFAGLTDRQAAGELPTNVVTQDFCGGRFATETHHGTGVAEIVHEMAPDAQLLLLCVDTEVDLANAEAFAKAQGAKVISHSMGWFGPDRGDGSGPIGAVVNDARSAGILWVNAAGNEATTHWSGTFNDPNGDGFHEFRSDGDLGNSFIWPNNSEICGTLKWDEWPSGVSDFDLILALAGSGVIVDVSDGDQTGSQPPFEGLCVYQNTGRNLTAFWAIGGYRVTTSPRLDLFSDSPSLQYQTAAGSVTEPATSPAAFAVGALCWQSKQLEFYSSQGPTIDGRTKPDIAGHDSVSNATYGPSTGCVTSGFAGTSAAAPEVAGAAALVKQAFPAYTADQIQQFLQKSARDIGTPGADNATGAGELQLPKPPDLVAPTSRAIAVTGHAGKMVKLLFSAADDEGTLGVVEQVKRNGHVIATLEKSNIHAASARTFSIGWKSPGKPKGVFQHCVVAEDVAGNKSAVSCAKISLK